ncbi:phosphoribosyltransferase family protein [Planktosalinus lacus]|uniref:Phosphoribosyltransferase n=1 Tax=Planktosalinus lacus TaxID=1526573 RepID=A0A8J2Y9W1_9FLAO|nr:phosphoribosyltransferase family protein [Planktosalinus lacus]GGD91293.1 phosphoribosyltransferase [Planktosalinus lacus]
MLLEKNQILDHSKIERILMRMAYQIYESNVDETHIVLAGIKENGFLLAKKLKTEVEKIAPLKVILCVIEMDKKSPLNTIKTSIPLQEIQSTSIVVIDDVLHSGSTLIHAVKYILEVPVKQIKTAVLIDRNHKKFPVKADFKGISLSTSLNENVSVIFEKNNNRAVLE